MAKRGILVGGIGGGGEGSKWVRTERRDTYKEVAMGTRIPLSPETIRRRELESKLEMSTAEIGLSVRTTNCLEERGILTVRDLLNSRPETLLGIANFGEKTLEEVYRALEAFGFYRKSKSVPGVPSNHTGVPGNNRPR